MSEWLIKIIAYSWGASWNLWPPVQDCISFLPKYFTFTHTCIKQTHFPLQIHFIQKSKQIQKRLELETRSSKMWKRKSDSWNILKWEECTAVVLTKPLPFLVVAVSPLPGLWWETLSTFHKSCKMSQIWQKYLSKNIGCCVTSTRIVVRT